MTFNNLSRDLSGRKPIGARQRFRILSRDSFRCRYCGAEAGAGYETILEIDHVLPVAEGGGNDDENLVAACFLCNAGKGRFLLPVQPPLGPDEMERREGLLGDTFARHIDFDEDGDLVAAMMRVIPLDLILDEARKARAAGEDFYQLTIRCWARYGASLL